jgi:Domain of unknown function (DUF5597)/Beta-galactosidase
MLPRSAALSFLLTAVASAAFAQSKPIPRLVNNGSRYSFIVDGKPFLILGGQVDNRVFVPEEMAKVLPGFKSYHANTVEFPVPWKLIEPKEGRFEFAAFDRIVRDIRAHGLRAIVLWFGTWKGDETAYLPEWIQSNPARFPKAVDAEGKPSNSLSPHGAATLEADCKAFAALLSHIREIDERDRTVILVQVENEPGIVGPARDRSPEANKLFGGPVPSAFAAALGKSPGTWTQTFGPRFAEEAFTTYYMARYIDSVAKSGKAAYPLPMYENVWMGGAGTNDRFYDFDRPGDSYPSGGGQSHTIDLWKAAAPAVDLIAPDIYHRSSIVYNVILSRYARRDNPLLIVETGRGIEFARYCFMAIGDYSALGFAQFGVGIGMAADGDFGPRFADMAANFRLLGNAAPVILELEGTKKLQSAIEEESIPGRMLSFDRYDVLVMFPPALARQPSWVEPTGPPPVPSGRALLAQLQPDEFLVIGFDSTIAFRPPADSGHKEARFAQVEEGRYENGAWTPVRSLPAVSPARDLTLPKDGAILRVKLQWE